MLFEYFASYAYSVLHLQAKTSCEDQEPKTPRIRTPLRDVSNMKRNHLRQVEATASPVLKQIAEVYQ